MPTWISDWFTPRWHWGAEFLSDEVRLFSARDKSLAPGLSFRGSYAEAEIFARKHGLRYQGFASMVSHIPYRIRYMGPFLEGENEDEFDLEQLKLPGSRSEDFAIQVFPLSDARFSVICSEAALSKFQEELPHSLSTLYDLGLGPLPVLDAIDKNALLETSVLVWPEPKETHILFLHRGNLRVHAKIHMGLNDARERGPDLARAFRNVLIYFWETKAPESPIQAIYLGRDGVSAEMQAALSLLSEDGLAILSPPWLPEFTLVASEFRPVAALAHRHARGELAPLSLSNLNGDLARSHRNWLARSQRLFRIALVTISSLTALALSLGLFSGGLHLYNRGNIQSHSGQLQQWQRVQVQKQSAEAEWKRLKPTFDKRTLESGNLLRIANLIPEGLWLKSWTLEREATGPSLYTLSGYSLEESSVTLLLAALESQGGFKSVKLRSTEMVPADKVVKETKIPDNNRNLIAFQIMVQP